MPASYKSGGSDFDVAIFALVNNQKQGVKNEKP